MTVIAIDPPLAVDQIQGNILAGFNKDHQTQIFFQLPQGLLPAQAWLAELSPDIATTHEVSAFNDLFKLVNARRDSTHRGERGTVEATWVNVAFTYTGLQKLQAPNVEQLPAFLQQGMAARAALTGDVGDNDPANWKFGQTGTIDGVVIVAADSAEDMDREVAREHRLLARHQGTVVYEQRGQTRTDLPGHEHFGFKDGVSQPGIRGFTDSPGDPNQGQPGQDLLWPGEFVIGYPGQQLPPAPGYGQDATARSSEPIQDAGPTPVPQPDWAMNGSYLVVRRLRQDVPGFLAAVTALASDQSPKLSFDQMGAKLVGRYRSGAPREPVAGIDSAAEAEAGDPSFAHPELLDDANINNFEYAANDASGEAVPLASHIRKAYPRDEATVGGGEADTQTHRILRRGIPFGKPYDDGAPSGTPHGDTDYPEDRGLLFACYQTDIANQFEFVQFRWADDPGFPDPSETPGQDPIISQNAAAGAQRPFTLPGGNLSALQLMKQWVTTTGGEYFFQPSIDALSLLSGSPAQAPAPTS